MKGEIEVKLLRTPTGKKIGPGAYDLKNRDIGSTNRSHNIMGANFYSKYNKLARKKSTSTERRKSNISNITTSIESIGSSSGNSIKKKITINIKKPNTCNKQTSSGRSSEMQLSVQGSSEIRDISTTNDSYDIFMSKKKEQRTRAIVKSIKNIGKIKQIVQESQTVIKNEEIEKKPETKEDNGNSTKSV